MPLWCGLLLLAALPTCGAEQKPSTSSATPPGNAPASVVPLGRPEGLIHIDVTVATPGGRAVIGLKQKRFVLLDNGRRNPIVSFDRFDLLHQPDPPVSVIFLLDTLGMPASQADAERQGLEAFLRRNEGHLPQPVTIYAMNDVGFGLAARASQDGNALAAAVERKQYLTKPMGSPSNMFSASAGFPVVEDYATAPVITGLRALGTIATDARAVPGRKLLIWIGPGADAGSGTPLVPAERWNRLFRSVTLSLTGHPNQSRLLVGQEDIFQKITWYSLLLRDARITLDTVSVAGAAPKSRKDPPGVDWTRFLPGAATLKDAEPMKLYKNVLAVQSGGEAVSGGNLTARLAALLRFSGYFYTLTFNPPPARQAHEYHTLKVELRDSGLKARTVTGYYDEPYYADESGQDDGRVTIAQLTRIVQGMRDDPGSDSTRQLQHLHLSERLDDAQLSSLQSRVRDRDARKALQTLAVLSQFQDPPRSQILDEAQPSPQEQRQMLAQVTGYLDHAIPRLPDFSATRTALEYMETPAYSGGLTSIEPEALQVVRVTHGMVHYRDGDEVVQLRGHPGGQPGGTIRAYGTFGPILKTVRNAFDLSGAFTWRHWERGPEGKLAVFRYRVPARQSKFLVQGCCLPDGDGTLAYATLPGYHGDLAVDPASGAIYRIDLIVDFHDFVPQDEVKMMVSYGQVKVAGISYVVPIRSISMGRARQVEMPTEWLEPAKAMTDTGEHLTGRTNAFLVEGFRTWGPWTTMLSEYSFEHYRISRGAVKILPGFSEVPGAPAKP